MITETAKIYKQRVGHLRKNYSVGLSGGKYQYGTVYTVHDKEFRMLKNARKFAGEPHEIVTLPSERYEW